MRFHKHGIAALVAAAAVPITFSVAAGTASASTAIATNGSSIGALAAANLGRHACSINSRGGRGYASSCFGNGGQPEYWCADFARWVWSQEGVRDVGWLNALAGSFYTYGKHFGTLTSYPAVGDVAVFNYSGGEHAEHVAVVTQVNPNGSVETVSGDWGGQSGTEAHFSSTSTVYRNAPAYSGTLGTYEGEMGMRLSAFVAPVGVPVSPVLPHSIVPEGRALSGGQSIASPNGWYHLSMTTEGDLVEYGGGRGLWQSDTGGNPGAHAVVEAGGNFAVLDRAGTPLWQTHTGGHSGTFSLALANDGSVLDGSPGGLVWGVRPPARTLSASRSLLGGQRLIANNGVFTVAMQSDGNLVEYSAGRELWASGTGGHTGAHAVMQADGNFVIYSGGRALWSSGTSGHTNSKLVLRDDGSLVVRQGSSTVRWSNRV